MNLYKKNVVLWWVLLWQNRSNTSAEFDATPQKARAFLVQEDDIYEPIHNVPTVRGNTFITSTGIFNIEYHSTCLHDIA
jgi:hypothetical protein